MLVLRKYVAFFPRMNALVMVVLAPALSVYRQQHLLFAPLCSSIAPDYHIRHGI